MGCVQSYFKKGSYDVYEAHNAGMSPSSTHDSEKSPLGEKEIKAQEETDDVQTAEIVRDLATVDQGEVKNLRDDEDAQAAETKDSSVLDKVATTATVAGVGAATVAGVGAALAGSAGDGDVSTKEETEELPASEEPASEQEPTGADTKLASEITDDTSDDKCKTELEQDTVAKSCSPATLEEQEEGTTIPLDSSRPISAAAQDDFNDATVTRRDEQLLSDTDTPAKDGISSVHDELNEATILEDPTKETDGFVVLGENVQQDEIPTAPVNVDTRPTEVEVTSDYPNEKTTKIGENVSRSMAVNEEEQNSTNYTTQSRPLSTENITPSKCDSVNEPSRTSSVEPEIEVISKRPASISDEKVERLVEITPSVGNGDVTNKTVDEHTEYSPSVDSAEEAFVSRPLSVASENVDEPTKETDTVVASEVANTNVEAPEAAEEASLSGPISVTSEEPANELTQRTPISLHSETEKEHSEGSPSIESAEEAVPSRPTSVASETSGGPVKQPTPTIPMNLANEINEEGANIFSPIEAAEEAETNRPTSAISEPTNVQEKPTTSEKYDDDEIQVTVSPEVTNEAKEMLGTKIASIEDTAGGIDTSIPLKVSNNTEEHNDEVSSAEQIEQLIDEISEGHEAKPSPEKVSEVIPAKFLDETNENVEQIDEDSNPISSLEKTNLGTLINEENGEGMSANVGKYPDKSCLELAENTVAKIPLETNNEGIEKYALSIGPAEAVGKELRSSPVNLATEAVENHYENISPAELAEETGSSRPVSAISVTATENVEMLSHIDDAKDNLPPTKSSVDIDENFIDFERPSTVVHSEVDSPTTPPSTPINIDNSEESTEKPFGDFSKIPSRTDIETVIDIPAHEEELEEPNEVDYDNLEIPYPKPEEETAKREIMESDEKIEEHEYEKENIPSRPLSEASETGGVKSGKTVMSTDESAIPSRPVSVFNETVDEPVEETTRSETHSVANENVENKTDNDDVEPENTISSEPSSITARSVGEIGDKQTIHGQETPTPAQPTDDTVTNIASPALSTTENITDITNSGNDSSEATTQEKERPAKSASLSETEQQNQDDAPNENVFNQEDVAIDKESEVAACINEKMDDAGTEDSITADNDTEDVEKEDSTIASIPESILTVPESMGDMELSSESSVGGPNEKSIEETKSEESRPDEQEDSSLVANLTDEPDTDIVANSSASDNGDGRIVDTPDQKDKITKAIINGVEDESTGEQLYADAFGRPVPTITLIESEEPKRSDSEEENIETPSTENREPYTAPEDKDDDILRNKGFVENAGNSPVNNSQEDSESVAGSDSINLQHRDDGRSDSSTSQSRADSVVAEKGSEVDSIATTMSATPSADGARLASEEDHEASAHTPSGLDGSRDAQEVALNDAATTIQASFRGFQTRQALQKNVETAEVPTKENQDNGSQGAPEHEDTSDAMNIPPSDHKDDNNGADISLESSDNSTLHKRPLEDSDGPAPPEDADECSEELANLQKPQECDELPEHRGEVPMNGVEAASSGDADSSLSSAATKIQAGFRGYVTRKQMRDMADDSTLASLTNEPSLPDSPQSFGTFSTSKEDNGVRTSNSLETAVQRQQQSTLDEIEELVGSGPPLLVDTSVYQVDKTNLPDEVVTDTETVDEKKVNEAKAAVRGLSLDSKVDSAAKSRKNTAKPSSLQEKSTTDIEEDQKVWDILHNELAEAATKIQSNYRGYRARQKLTREDAVQLPTTSTSSAASVDSDKAVVDTEIRASGEFHDMMVLPPGEIAKLTNGNDA